MTGALATAAWGLYLAALAALAAFALHRLTLVARARRALPAIPPVAGDDVPVVTVQLPIYNEQAVAERVIAAACALDWPRDRLEVQVLDDSTDDTRARCAAAVAAARAAGVDAHHLHRADRVGWKAGALDAGRAVARGTLHAVFDADFVPPPDFLRRTIGGFADPRVAMVQARWDHLNRDASLLTRLQALLLDGHFAVEQRGRAASGACFNFNGTAGVWRATAIADAGGWHADTLTEDLDLSYRAALRGWRFAYAADVRAPAELPADVAAFKAQQFRWAKGSIECARKLAAPAARAPWRWRHRVEALFHLGHNLPYLLTLIVLVAGGAAVALGGGPAWAPAVHAASAVATVGVLAAFVIAADGARAATVARLPALVALTAGIWRARAIADAGGWHADTLTEDLDLSYRAALAGWRFVYAGDVIVPAELPADVLAFKSQQHRWAKGSIECARKLAPAVARARWSPAQKVEAALHLAHNVPYLLTLVVLLAGGVALAAGGGPALAVPVHLAAAAITLAVPATFAVASQRGLRRSRWGALVRVPALAALTAGMAVSQTRAIVQAALGRTSEFVRTPKDGATGAARRRPTYRVPAGWIVVGELGLAAYLAACATFAAQHAQVGATAILAWLALGAAAVGISSVRAARRR